MGFDGYIEFRKKLQEEEVMRFTPAERFRRLVDNKYLSNAEKMEYKEIDPWREHVGIEPTWAALHHLQRF